MICSNYSGVFCKCDSSVTNCVVNPVAIASGKDISQNTEVLCLDCKAKKLGISHVYSSLSSLNG